MVKKLHPNYWSVFHQSSSNSGSELVSTFMKAAAEALSFSLEQPQELQISPAYSCFHVDFIEKQIKLNPFLVLRKNKGLCAPALGIP